LDTKSVLDKNYKSVKRDAADAIDSKSTKGLSDHPLLTHVRSFNGGAQSYHAAIRVRDPKTCKVVASWTNGQPLIVEGPVPTAKKSGTAKQSKCVVLNFYVCLLLLAFVRNITLVLSVSLVVVVL
jgi:hypothetical protein